MLRLSHALTYFRCRPESSVAPEPARLPRCDVRNEGGFSKFKEAFNALLSDVIPCGGRGRYDPSTRRAKRSQLYPGNGVSKVDQRSPARGFVRRPRGSCFKGLLFRVFPLSFSDAQPNPALANDRCSDLVKGAYRTRYTTARTGEMKAGVRRWRQSS